MLHETVVLQDAVLEVELHADLRYRLRYGDLVEYADGRRKVRDRTTRYEFRSVEQLRYDFERDVEALGGRLGEGA
jgi:dihydroneopterin aldolase